jgi:hypothetical protein
MAEPRFDPGGFYEFDLEHGAVRTRGGARVLMLTDSALGALVSSPLADSANPGAREAVGKELGRVLAAHVASSLPGKKVGDCAPETVLGHAAAVLGLFGWGRLGFERWGDLLVLTLDGSPRLDAQGAYVAALLGGLLTSLSGRDVACVPLRNHAFAAISPPLAEQVAAWARAGSTPAQIVDRLESGGA